MNDKKTQSGYTLIEAIAFICIITAVVIGIIKVIGSMLDRYKISRVTSQVAELQRAINNRFSASENYSKLTLTLLKDENLAPGDANWSGTSLKNKYGGDITVGSNYSSTDLDITGSKHESYYIKFEKLPKKACVELATQNWMHDQYSNLATMIVNGTNCYWRQYGENGNLMPLSNDTAIGLCAEERENTIQWVFQ